MKDITTSELTAKEAKAISHALDIARKITQMDTEDRPEGFKYISGDALTIKALSFKFYSDQITGATITQVTDTDV
jgi:hypothetical protein